jgi:hypothetical protein
MVASQLLIWRNYPFGEELYRQRITLGIHLPQIQPVRADQTY